MSWKPVACVLVTALAAMLIPALGQESGLPRGSADKRLESDKAAAERRRGRNVETLRKMQGGWQLVELRVSGLPDAGRQDVGYLIVSGEFASLEIHMAYFDESGEEEESFIQTGTYRLNFNIYGDLLATLLIGSVDGGHGMTFPQAPGLVSVHEVWIEDGVMTMTSYEGTRFIFEPMATGKLTKLLYEKTDWLPRVEEAAAVKDEDAKR